MAIELTASSAFAVFMDQSAAVLLGANYTTRSASLADYDGDGDLDLMLQTSPANNQIGFRLLRNNLINSGGSATFTFTEVTSSMLPTTGLTNIGMWSAAWGDYNGDGRPDVFVGASSGTGTLLKNNGGSSPFTNVNASVGLNTPNFTSSSAFSQNVAWGDFNNDHRLDLVVGMEGPKLNQLYLQQANGSFLESGATVGIQSPVGQKSYGMAIGDYDGDGDTDIYISTCAAGSNIANALYKNMLKENGTLSFVDVAAATGTQNLNNTYGTQFIDMDNDGKLDLVLTGADGQTYATKTKIYRNNGNGTFTDVDTISGHNLLSDVGSDLNGLKVVDYDNDGKLDLYFHDNLSGTGNQKLYHNEGNWTFTDVTAANGLSGSANTGAGGYDSTWGDLDRDGDMDLIDTNNATLSGTATPEKAYINDATTNGNHWLQVKLSGPSWNTTGIGASLYATPADGSLQGTTLRREANTDADTFNQSAIPVHFGLGTSSVLDWLRVVWPDGTSQFLRNVSVDQYMTISYAPPMAGDFNSDGVVDGNDYVLWRKYFGTVFTINDYNDWRTHFGLSPGAGAASAVPEPDVILILAMAGLTFTFARRRS